MEGSKILIILDDFDLRSKITKILEIGKYNVRSTDSGRKGIDMIRSSPVDVIICSPHVSDIDGFGVLRVLNQFIETATVSFIMLLHDQDYHLAKRATEMGAEGFLTTPFDDGELLNQVEVRLRKKRFRYELFLKEHLQLKNIVNNGGEMSWLRSRFEERIPRHFKKNQMLYYREEKRSLGLHYILSGKIKTYVTDSLGNILVTGIYGPSEHFGFHSILLGAESTETAEAIDSSEVVSIPFKDVQNMISEYPNLLGIFIRDQARSLKEREERLLELAYYSVRKRIANAVIRLTLSGRSAAGNAKLLLPRHDLASLIGVATETLSRVLGDFAKEGLIEKEGNEIIILDMETLGQLKN